MNRLAYLSLNFFAFGMSIELSPLWISLKTASTATIIAFFWGIIIARLMLDFRGKLKGAIDSILLAPLVLPPTVVGFLLLLLLGKNGPVGKFLGLWDIRIIFTWYATVIAAVVVAFPLMYQTTLGAFKQIDYNLIEAARTLGASETKIFWQVMLPLAKPGLISGMLLTFARALGEFGATLMLAGSIPGETQTIPVAIYFASESGAIDQALFWVVLILFISFTVVLAINYLSDYGYRQKKSSTTLVSSPNILARSFASLRMTTRTFNILSKSDRETLDFTFYKDSNKSTELIVIIQKKLANFTLDVSFDSQQQPLGLLGGSGAGKSMILRCIAGLETPDRGQIILNGRVLFDSDKGINLPSCQRQVGFLFQNYGLFPHLTVAENIIFVLSKKQSKLLTKQQIEAQLLALNLQGLANRYPEELSGGQQQRVALARVLASDPEILLFDEPFSALDTYLHDRLEKLLINLLNRFGAPTLFVTHNLEEAYRVCDNLIVLDEGKIIAHDTKDNIFEHPLTFRTAQLTGCKNFSLAMAINSHQVRADYWECDLSLLEAIPANIAFVMIRAHQINFVETAGENTFPGYVVKTTETPHRVTVYLKLNRPPEDDEDYHLQAEVFKEKWQKIKDRPFPWLVQLHPRSVCALTE